MITVLANGVFDMQHYGHLLHLEQARSLGDRLVVSITSDEEVNKGPGRPVYSQDHRAALVQALKCVDEVLIVTSLLEALRIVRPDILVKGIDYKDGLDEVHENYCKYHNIKIVFTDTPKYSAAEFLEMARKNDRPIPD